jgi:hypothetical protein
MNVLNEKAYTAKAYTWNASVGKVKSNALGIFFKFIIAILRASRILISFFRIKFIAAKLSYWAYHIAYSKIILVVNIQIMCTL